MVETVLHYASILDKYSHVNTDERLADFRENAKRPHSHLRRFS